MDVFQKNLKIELESNYDCEENTLVIGSVRQGVDLIFVDSAIKKASRNSQRNAIIVQDSSAKYFAEYSAYLQAKGYQVYQYNLYDPKCSLINFDSEFYAKNPAAIFVTTPSVFDGLYHDASVGFFTNVLLEIFRQSNQQNMESKETIHIILSDLEALDKINYLPQMVGQAKDHKIIFKLFTKSIQEFKYLYGINGEDNFRVVRFSKEKNEHM